MIPRNPGDLASLIDHTLLRADATRPEIDRLCQEALTYHFATVCLNPVFVTRANQILFGSDVKVCTVIGFPLGASVTAVKVREALQAVADGARELDMVIQLGALKEARYGDVEEDIRSVVRAVPENITVKAILETCLWKEEQIRKACRIAVQAGVHFVKTSTGFSSGGASLEAVRIMRETVGERTGIKASGGIRDFEFAKALVEAGATRIGASASLAIIGVSGSKDKT
jgi:deoxyribose-phosphate aldolase